MSLIPGNVSKPAPETPSLSSKAACYTDILEKTGQKTSCVASLRRLCRNMSNPRTVSQRALRTHDQEAPSGTSPLLIRLQNKTNIYLPVPLGRTEVSLRAIKHQAQRPLNLCTAPGIILHSQHRPVYHQASTTLAPNHPSEPGLPTTPPPSCPPILLASLT